MTLIDQLKPGDKIYYPSNTGIALICEVIDLSKDDVLVKMKTRQFYLPKESVEAHGILMDEKKGKAFIAQRIEDPENNIIYLRYMWNESWFDRAYNEYCKREGRLTEALVIPPAAVDHSEEIEPMV